MKWKCPCGKTRTKASPVKVGWERITLNGKVISLCPRHVKVVEIFIGYLKP